MGSAPSLRGLHDTTTQHHRAPFACAKVAPRGSGRFAATKDSRSTWAATRPLEQEGTPLGPAFAPRAGPPPTPLCPWDKRGHRLRPDLTVLSSEAVDSPRAVRNMLGSSLYVWLQLRERCRRGAVIAGAEATGLQRTALSPQQAPVPAPWRCPHPAQSTQASWRPGGQHRQPPQWSEDVFPPAAAAFAAALSSVTLNNGAVLRTDPI